MAMKRKKEEEEEEVFQTVDIRKSAITSLPDVLVGEVLNLAFLGGVFGSPEGWEGSFMPKSLYVRDEMHSVWRELEANYANTNVKNQVLIGSPGVGKSILFFLYALHRALGGKKVMYWRKDQSNTDYTSLFCMKPVTFADNEKGVCIQFTSSIAWEKNINDIYDEYIQKAFPDLYGGKKYTEAVTVRLLAQREVLMFADGPRYEEKKDTKAGSIHFLCTSGGHPSPKDCEWTSFMVVVMAGWGKGPYTEALKRYAIEDVVKNIWETEMWGEEKGGQADMDVDTDNDVPSYVPSYKEKLEEVVDLVYYYTGGRIHDALKIVTAATTIERFARYFSKFVIYFPPEGIDLAVRKKYGTKAIDSFDTLQTYFGDKGKEGCLQIVDSAYVLSLLEDLEMEAKYLDAYKEAITLDEKTIAGHHFEKLMHKVFIRISKDGGDEGPLKGHTQSVGKTIEGVCQIEKNKYWIPSVPNFPGIDGALVCDDGSICGVQYFAGKRHGFKVRAFKSQFLYQIPQAVGAEKDSVWIVFVVPKDQNGVPDDLDEFEFRVVTIDTESIDSVTRDAKTVFQK